MTILYSELTAVEKDIVYKALLARRVEEKLLTLFSDGKLSGTIHTCIGQEFSGAVLSQFHKKGDAIFSNHRCHGHFLSFTLDVNGLVAEIMGKANGVCGGRGGSQHLCKDGFYSNGIQGGIAPIAAGIAMGKKINKTDNISFVFIGDGTLGEGVLYETLNIASKWELPILFILENNGYAQSTNSKETLAGEICAKAHAFNIPTDLGSTYNWQELYRKANSCVNFVRTEKKPFFLQVDTFRLRAHSKGDDYREKKEIENRECIDPLNVLLSLEKNKKIIQELEQSIQNKIGEAIKFSDSSNYPTYTNEEITNALTWNNYNIELPRIRVSEAINRSLEKIMKKNENMLLIGEDIKSPYGGTFKVSEGLSTKFPERVLNTPISEAAIVGIGSGLAIEGFRPFIEIMFGDFATLCFDQLLNHAAKFEFMYNEQVKLNLVVRTPMGGNRSYGATHSQTLDRHFLGIPGLRVLVLNNLIDVDLIYTKLVEMHCGPTLLLENKIQYTQFIKEKLPTGFHRKVTNEVFPCVHIYPQTKLPIDATLIAYGGMAESLLQAVEILFHEKDILCQILCPTQIYPFAIKPYFSVLEKTEHLIFIEEGQGFANFSAEILSQIAEVNPLLLRSSLRLSAKPIPIPASSAFEKQVLPQIDQLVRAVVKLCRE